MTHKELLQAFQQMPFEEKRLAISLIGDEWEGRDGLIAELGLQLEQSRVGTKLCPHCKSGHTIRRGTEKGVEQFTCKDCKKHFRGSFGTALYRIQRKDKWQAYLRLMEQGYSIKKAAKELGISIQTSFDWRHKILSSVQSTLPEKIGGVVECDEFQLAESFKGAAVIDREPHKRGNDSKNHKSGKVSVVTAVSRGGNGAITVVVAAKKISSEEAGRALENRLEDKTLLITDENSAYNIVSEKNKEITHKTINSVDNRTKKPHDKIHIQTVNNQHSQIRDFLKPFKGVATKYLPNYLNWFVYRKMQNTNKEKLTEMLKTCLSAGTALIWLLKIFNDEVLIRT